MKGNKAKICTQGIYIEGPEAIVSDNFVEKATTDGINCSSGVFTINGNQVKDSTLNLNYGIIIVGANDSTCSGNKVFNALTVGIYVDASDNVTVGTNRIKSSGDGIHLRNASRCTVGNNTCQNNTNGCVVSITTGTSDRNKIHNNILSPSTGTPLVDGGTNTDKLFNTLV